MGDILELGPRDSLEVLASGPGETLEISAGRIFDAFRLAEAG